MPGFGDPHYQPRLTGLTDIPIERASLGAMGINAAPESPAPFRPYVYRGKGYDLLEGPPLEPLPKTKPKRKYKKRKRRVRDRYHWAPVVREWHDEPEPHTRYWTDDNGQEIPGPPEHQPDPFEHLNLPKPIRPAEGWKPMTGADIDALLEGLDDGA